MEHKNDGGPAFPNITPNMPVDDSPGMTLRDWFAGQAVGALIQEQAACCLSDGDHSGVDWGHVSHEMADDVARSAYACADAMIAERRER